MIKRILTIFVLVPIFSAGAWADSFTDYRQAAGYQDAGQYGAAIALYSAVIADEALDRYDLGVVFYKRGTAREAMGHYERAIDDYYEALRLTPFYPHAYYRRALAYQALGKPQQAIQDFSFVLLIHPTNGQALYQRGNAYQQIGSSDRALQDWERSFEHGGAELISSAQERLIEKGYYSGPIDGVVSTGFREAMHRCAASPDC